MNKNEKLYERNFFANLGNDNIHFMAAALIAQLLQYC